MIATSGGVSGDVVVVGGGVIGLSVAYELARRGRRPKVLDRGPEPGVASRAAAGMLAPISEAQIEEQPLVDFGRESLRRFPEFVRGIEEAAGVSCGFRREGTLWAALDRDEAGELEHLARAIGRRGMSARRLGAEEVLAREPLLSSRIVGGLLVEEDLQVDPRALCEALASAILRLGGTIERSTPVSAVEVAERGGLRVQVARAPARGIDCAAVVIAAGAWAGEGICLPVEPPRIRPVKGQLLRLRGAVQIRHVVRTPDCYLVPRLDGELLVGATLEEAGYDTRVTAGAVHDLLRHAWRLLPGIYELELAEVSVGLRPLLEDQLPAIGATEVEGLYFAAGHGRNGVLLAPASAHYLAEAIVSGAPQEQLAPFSPVRLGRAAVRMAERR